MDPQEKAATDLVTRNRTLSSRQQRILYWARKPQFVAVMIVLLLVCGFGIYRAASAPHNNLKVSWKSGVSFPTSVNAVGATQAFASWRDLAIGVAVAWPARATWADFTQVNSFYTTWAGQSYTKSFGIPLFPDDVGATIEGCIAGNYNHYWRTFANTMNSTGLSAQGTIIRLGWEFNQDPQSGSPSQFAACFRQIESTVSAIAPGLVWDWNVNRGPSDQMPGNSVLDAYPGNQYVNLIGVDSYDDWPAANTAGGWQDQLNGPYGLNFWLNFAKAHGKLLSVPEWGVATGSMWPGHEGGDDPSYIKDMYNFFSANEASIAFESYYNESETAIFDPAENPAASAEYQKLWG